jgi:hypothetical protein
LAVKGGCRRYIELLNSEILPFIDYQRLNKSYETDMAYAKGILNRLHEAMVTVYGSNTLDEANDFVVIPGVIRGRESGKMCIALLELDLSSSGEHWGTKYLSKYGVIDQSGSNSKPLAKELNADYIPYYYGYTAVIPDDIHISFEGLPAELRMVLTDFRQHYAVLINEREPESATPAITEAEFAARLSELVPGADVEGIRRLIIYAKYLEREGAEPIGDFFKNTLIEYYLVSEQYGQEIALQLIDICKSYFTLNPFEMRGAAYHLKQGVAPADIESLIEDGQLDPPNGEPLGAEDALKEYQEKNSKAQDGIEKPSVLAQIRAAERARKALKKSKPPRKKSEPEH